MTMSAGKRGAKRWGMTGLTALVLALAQGAAPAPLAAAGTSEAETELARLIEAAETAFAQSANDAAGAQRVVAAWQAVRAAAGRIAPDHPEVARADIKIASQLYVLGRNAEARAQVERGLAALATSDPDNLVLRAEGVALLGTILAHGGEAESAVATLEQAYAQYLTAFAALPEAEVSRDTAVARSNLEFSLSQVLLQLSRIDAALAYQKASLETRERFLGPNDPDTIASYYGYAGVLRRAGQMEEAERYARIAVERAVAHVDPAHASYARALEMLAIILARTGRPVEATGYLARSLELKRQHEGADSLFFGYGLHLLGMTYLQRERYGDALPLLEEAAPIFARYQGENSPFGLGAQAYAAQATFALGHWQEALERLRAVDARMQASTVDNEIAKRIGPDLVRALIRQGETAEAARIAARDYARLLESENAEALTLRHARLVEARARSMLAARPADALEEARAMLAFLGREAARTAAGPVVAEQRAALDLVMEIAVDCGDADLMAQAMARITGSGLAQATALRAERLSASDPALAEALRALQQADAAIEAADRELLRALAAGTSADAARAALAAADEARREALAALAARDAATARLVSSDPVDVAAIRAGLGKGEALLALAPAYDGAYSLLVTADAALVRRLDLPRAELVALAAAVRESAVALDFDAAAAARLAAVLLPPETRAALKGAQTLRILAGGPLASLPFGLLVLEPGEEARAPTWLADRFALVNVASLADRARRARPQARGLVAFAAPVPFASGGAQGAGTGAEGVMSPAAYFARRGADAARLALLPPLPGAAREARAIAQAFGPERSRLFLGAEASEARLADPGVREAEVLVFATHGLVGGELEGVAEPALVLSPPAEGAGDQEFDGLLTASEIARLDLSADWVILTACDSAAGFEGGAPAFSGLVSAFRFAGGGTLLATHWQVRDDVAAYVATEMLRHYRRHGDKAKALRHALDRLRRQSGLPGADQPDIWAPFVLID